MSVKSFQPEIGPKQVVQITTVDQKRRRIEARLKDGGIVLIPILNIPTLFRWPKVNEYWVIRQEAGQWNLVESTDPTVQMRDGDDPNEKAILIENMREGEVRLTASPNNKGSGVWLNKHQAARKVLFVIGEDSSFELNHQLETEHVQTTLFQEEGLSIGHPTITVDGPNTVLLEFSESIPKDSIRVIITG